MSIVTYFGPMYSGNKRFKQRTAPCSDAANDPESCPGISAQAWYENNSSNCSTPTPTATPTNTPTATPTATPCERPSEDSGALGAPRCAEDYCEQTYGPGWFYWQGTSLCVPPECASCIANGGTQCNQQGDCWTPVLIDIEGDGFALTSKDDGILFRPSPGANHIETAWTAYGTDDAWLVLDRNENGTIDDGSELFSCAAPQPDPPPGDTGNGFIALAEFDKIANGGNDDGLISKRDTVFNELRLWQDVNHNGISESSELFTLPALGLRKIDLDYKTSNKTDQYGNKFKYRAKVKDAQDAQLGRWAWDVFLVASEH